MCFKSLPLREQEEFVRSIISKDSETLSLLVDRLLETGKMTRKEFHAFLKEKGVVLPEKTFRSTDERLDINVIDD